MYASPPGPLSKSLLIVRDSASALEAMETVPMQSEPYAFGHVPVVQIVT